MIIAHISDLHVTAPGTLYQDCVASNDMAKAAIRTLRALTPAPKFVICTGDLTEHGTDSEYSLARNILNEIEVPCFVAPGNHDVREPFRAAFNHLGYLPREGPLHYGQICQGVHIVHLDSTVPGAHHGAIDEDGLAWLDSTLSAHPKTPTVVTTHHHPVASGIVELDAYINRSGTEIAAVLERHPQVVRLLFGHVHRHMSFTYGGTLAMACPSTASQIALRLGAADKSMSLMEPPGFLLHHLHDDGTMISHLKPIGDFGPDLDFF